MTPTDKADVLLEALPYLQRFRGKIFLIKIGGSAMENKDLLAALMRDIVFLEIVGIKPVIVHGGGKAISSAMEKSGLPASFVGGLRISTPEAIAIVEHTLNKSLNPRLVQMLNDHGGRACGMNGIDIFQAERIQVDAQGHPIDIGQVGRVTHCQLEKVDQALAAGTLPVITPLGREDQTGKTLNINADLAAAALACQLKPAKLVYLSDVPGLLSDPDDPQTLIPSIHAKKARQLIADQTIGGGMIPKVTSALDALQAGVEKIHFIDGRQPHALLLEIFTQTGIGTEIKKK